MDTVEQKLLEKMAEGWNISIECKGKGRTYELTYEGTATKVGKSPWEALRHAVGNTLDELVDNLFNSPVVSIDKLNDNIEGPIL